MSIALSQLHSRDRVNIVEPGRLHPAVSFARASTATYMGPGGILLTAAINAPRFEYDSIGNYLGLLIEASSTNVLLNSATLSTQSVTLTATTYTLSFWGTGTVTLTGVATGSLVGTGASNRVTKQFTATAGSLTLTVSGSVTNAQLEKGIASGFDSATSYISTTSSAVTRSADVCLIDLSAMGVSLTNGTLIVGAQINYPFSGAVQRTLYAVNDGSDSNMIRCYLTTAVVYDVLEAGVTVGSTPSPSYPAFPSSFKIAGSWTTGSVIVDITGGTVGFGVHSLNTSLLKNIYVGQRSSGFQINGHIQFLFLYTYTRPAADFSRLVA